LIGCASHHPKPVKAQPGPWRAVIGGMANAPASDAVIQEMDALAHELTPLAAARRIEDGIIVTLSNTLLFEFSSAELKPGSREPLRKMAAVFLAYPDTRLTIAGHTDNIGPVGYNIHLSERRAQAVAEVIADAGVPRARLRIMGLGFERPVAANDSAAGRARNRRVEIHIAPLRVVGKSQQVR